jgi:hypothetical protein
MQIKVEYQGNLKLGACVFESETKEKFIEVGELY